MIHAGIDGQRKELLPLQRFTAFLKKSSEMNTKQSIFSSIPTKLRVQHAQGHEIYTIFKK